jgi:two-component system sensor kinase FixL
MSPRFTEVTGGTAATPPEDLIHPEDVGAVMSAWRKAVSTGQPHHVEFRMRVRDGSYRMFLSRAAPRRDETGRIVRWYGFTEDIHDQQLAQAARLQAEERYRLAANATNDAIWDVDLQTDTIHWSDSEGGVFGHGIEGTTSVGWWEEKVHTEDREQVVESFWSALASDQDRWNAEYRFLCGDGAYAEVLDRGFIIRDVSGKAVRAVGAMSDVTKRRHAEAELRRLQAELIHISRVSAMGTMASTLAHELNQPLTAVSSYIGGSLRLLEDGGGSPDRLREALLAAEATALRGGQILRRLRELVARGNVAVRPERLAALVEEACELGFVDQRVLGVTHQVRLDRACPWVVADRIQVQQVLINLIRNAVQAMQESQRKEVAIRSLAKGNMVEISVADSGSGIDPDAREALFSAFRSTKREGMGIGLSISRTIVEAHGGKIWAEDRPGGGAIFRFTLPCAEAPGSD